MLKQSTYKDWQQILHLSDDVSGSDLKKLVAAMDAPKPTSLYWGKIETSLHQEIIHVAKMNIQNQAIIGVNLSYFDFSDTTIEFSVFKNCNLVATNFQKSQLINCSFENCLWINANCYKMSATQTEFKDLAWQKSFLHSMNIDRCLFKNVNLSHSAVNTTNFATAIFKNVVFEYCKWRDVVFPEGYKP